MTDKRTQFGFVTMVAALALVAAPAWAQCDSKKAAAASYGGKQDIVDIAASAGQFNTLVAAVKAAGLVEALKGEGPYTVFAPTDEAFAKLPKGTLETLLKPENKKQLQAILTYHVVPGKWTAKKVVKANGAQTLNGQRLDFQTKGESVMVDNAHVVKADIMASNGVIHVIDTVVLPSEKNIVETAASTHKFNTLLKAATAAGLAEPLSKDGPFTVFAPTDDAFAKLPAGTLESLLKPENRDQLAAILMYHVVKGRVYSTDALKAGTAEALSGQEIRIASAAGTARVNDARLLTTDVDASNGVIHVIDTVMIPN